MHLYKQACHGKAGKTDEAVVRLDGEPGKTPKVVVLLAAPNAALSQCLTDAAADIRLPFPRPNEHLTLVIPAHAREESDFVSFLCHGLSIIPLTSAKRPISEIQSNQCLTPGAFGPMSPPCSSTK